MSIKAVVTTVIGNAGYANVAGIATYAATTGIAYTSSAGIATYSALSGIATYSASSGIATYSALSGISTYSTSAGVATYATSSGISTYSASAGVATYATSSGISTYSTYSALSGISTDVIGGIASVTQLSVTGLSTFYNSVFIDSVSISSPESNILTFGTSNEERIRINENGSIGIGTNDPFYTLTVTNTGTPSLFGLPNCVLDVTSNVDAYSQINFHNASSLPNSSTDLVLTADNGTDSSNFVDLGINGSNYDVVGWTINGANDAYLYASDGNLSIGVAGSKYVSFFTSGTTDLNERIRITALGDVGIGSTEPQAKLHVEGNVRVSGIITATEGFASGIGITNPVQITVSGNILTFNVVGVGSTSLQLF
jgi:hypothetical protein